MTKQQVDFSPQVKKAFTIAGAIAFVSLTVGVVDARNLGAASANNSIPVRAEIGAASVFLLAIVFMAAFWWGARGERLSVRGDVVTYTRRGEATVNVPREQIRKLEVTSDNDLSPSRNDAWHLRLVDAGGQRLLVVRFANRYGRHQVETLAEVLGGLPVAVQPPLWT